MITTSLIVKCTKYLQMHFDRTYSKAIKLKHKVKQKKKKSKSSLCSQHSLLDCVSNGLIYALFYVTDQNLLMSLSSVAYRTNVKVFLRKCHTWKIVHVFSLFLKICVYLRYWCYVPKRND